MGTAGREGCAGEEPGHSIGRTAFLGEGLALRLLPADEHVDGATPCQMPGSVDKGGEGEIETSSSWSQQSGSNRRPADDK